MKEMLNAVDADKARAHGEKLQTLSNAFGELAATHGFGGNNCRKVCEDTIVIGSDGQPHHEVVCRIICT